MKYRITFESSRRVCVTAEPRWFEIWATPYERFADRGGWRGYEWYWCSTGRSVPLHIEDAIEREWSRMGNAERAALHAT